ncbi:hypothetical protein AMELA_G00084170 [Ameiurus melas]|uniref:C2H2-type domain-containing protein n=1 Tax=Ameiurus melas TaxID=219545 RepID=A0A7J6B0V1_AMEME|nr:hypothetical protein AMELA_G00084170 [Ameiurus melas]
MYHSSDIKLKADGEKIDHEDETAMHESPKTQTSNDSDHEGQDNEDQQSPKLPDKDELPDTQETSQLKPRMTYKCKDCGRVFRLLSVFQRHGRYHRINPSRVLLSCPHCPCRFTFRSALERHLENHDKEGSEKHGQEASPTAEANMEYLENEDDLSVERTLVAGLQVALVRREPGNNPFPRNDERSTRLHEYQDDSAEGDVEALDIYSMFFIVVNCNDSTDVLWMKFKYLLAEDVTQ